MTGNSVIAATLRMLGVLGEGEVPSPSEASDALEQLNAMLDAWNADRRKLYTAIVSSLTLVSGTQAYTWGTGGTFNVARPAKVDGAIAVIGDAGGTPATNKVRIPLELIQDAAEWAAIRSQTATNFFPEKVFVDGVFPLRNVKFWPVPTFSGTVPSVEFWTWVLLTAFADLTTTYTFPPGYELAIKANLAIILAPEYGKRVPTEVLTAGAESLASIAGLSPATLPSMLLDQRRSSQAAAPPPAAQ